MKKIAQFLLISSMAIAGAVVASSNTPATGIAAFENGQYHTALRLLATEADNGSTDALYALGLMHEYGLGVEKSNSQAAGYYVKGAEINTRDRRLVQARVFVNALERTAE